MEIDKENLFITKLIINNLKYFLNLAFIRSGVDIVVPSNYKKKKISISTISNLAPNIFGIETGIVMMFFSVS